MQQNMSFPYRPEIDGLRAVAVLAVMLFHAGSSAFPGGFVGVDVFFVISGFLITSLLLKDMGSGTFSVAHFYARRIRRLLPVMACVLAVCSTYAWWIMAPNDFRKVGNSLVAIASFSSNIYFNRSWSYFDGWTTPPLFLHTWSLAVEEQYYLFFPLLLYVALRLHRAAAFALTLAVFLGSLALSEWMCRADPNSNFYLLPTRAWELMAGSLLAFPQARALRLPSSAPVHGALSLAGLLLILFSVLSFNEKSPSPGLITLAPVFGTLLLIRCTQVENPVSRLLSHKYT